MVKLKRGDQGWTDFQGWKNTPIKKSEVLMDIRSIASAYGASGYDLSLKNGKKSDATTKPIQKASEVVAFSDTSLNMQKVKEAVNKAPDIRLPIVEKIKEKIKNDEYPVDLKANDIVDALMKNKIL
jgi:anti-sigma28 factor (negative regulator of flagellin synthesis)